MTVRSPIRMAPNGPKAQSGPRDAEKPIPQPPIPDDVVALDHSNPARGPHPGHVQVACQYTLEQKLRRMLKERGCDPAREDSYRLQGVNLIDSVREALHLYVPPRRLPLFSNMNSLTFST